MFQIAVKDIFSSCILSPHHTSGEVLLYLLACKQCRIFLGSWECLRCPLGPLRHLPSYPLSSADMAAITSRSEMEIFTFLLQNIQNVCIHRKCLFENICSIWCVHWRYIEGTSAVHGVYTQRFGPKSLLLGYIAMP